jgi:secreted trypsin-like serine protease
MVSLRTNGHFCGGTLIDARHVVTAAHCVTDVNPGSLNVVAGLHEQLNINTGRTQIRNDIAILRLSHPVTFNTYVSPICLPGPDPQESQPVTTIGWGTIYQDGPSSNVLREVTVQVANAEANAVYRDFNVQRQIAAGVPYVGGKDSCQGDSGGPLMYNSNGLWYLSGVVSFGDVCALRNHPGVYTRTSAYLNWINNKINAP